MNSKDHIQDLKQLIQKNEETIKDLKKLAAELETCKEASRRKHQQNFSHQDEGHFSQRN